MSACLTRWDQIGMHRCFAEPDQTTTGQQVLSEGRYLEQGEKMF